MTGFTLYAKVFGDSHPDTIVFLPGFVGSHEAWDKDFQSLSRNYKLVLLDTLGFGRSRKPDIEYSISDHVNSIKETLRGLSVESAHFVGHSMGAILALAYAYHFQEQAKKLTFLSLPWFKNEQEARETIKNTSLFNRLLAMDTPLAHMACTTMCLLRPLLMPLMPTLVPDVPAVVAKDGLRHTWTSYSRTLQNVIFRAQTGEWLQALRHPILMIHGIEDRTAPIENVRRGLAHLPHARLIELQTGHNFIFTHGAAVAEEKERFFYRSSASR